MSDENTQSLNDILNGVEVQDQVEQQEVEAEQPEETPEATAEVEEAAPAAAKEQKSDEENWTKAAVLDERRKRQDLERKYEELLSKQQKQEPQKAPDVFEDQEGFTNHIGQTLQNEVFKARVEISQELMREKHADYDEKEAMFADMAKESPELWQKLRASAMPAKFVYETVVKAERLKAMENIDEWESKKTAELEAKIRQQLEAEFAEKSKSKAAVSSLKPSLANARSSAPVNDEPIDRSLKELLNGR